MSFYSQTFLEHGVGDSNCSATANTVLYLPTLEVDKIISAWNNHTPTIIKILDTDGQPALLSINNTVNNRLNTKSFLNQSITKEAVRQHKTNKIYSLGTYSNVPYHYYDSATNIHLQSILPYSHNNELLLKILQNNYTNFNQYTPLGVFNNQQEYNNMNIIENVGLLKNSTNQRPQEFLDNSFEARVGREFSRTFDAKRNPVMY